MRTGTTEIISLDDIRNAIVRSGYLLEQRVKSKIEQKGYFVETNQPYPDPETGTSREYDVSAIGGIQIRRGTKDLLWPYIVCECENNLQPIVFFQSGSPINFLFHHHVKYSGLPTKFWVDGQWIRISEFLAFERFHHYCNGRTATQYCSFHHTKGRWIAMHPETQHQTFEGIINAVEALIDEHYGNYEFPRKGEKEPVSIQFYYPLVVLQGDVFLAHETRRGLNIRKCNHILYRRECWSAHRRDTYMIDVVKETYLPQYLRLVQKEMEAIKRSLRRKEADVRATLDRLTALARREGKTKKSWRQILEPTASLF